MTDEEDSQALGEPGRYLMRDLVANGKWNGRLQSLMKQKLERRFHSGDKLSQYAISIDELENKTGLDFFCNLPDDTENSVEADLTLSDWNLQ